MTFFSPDDPPLSAEQIDELHQEAVERYFGHFIWCSAMGGDTVDGRKCDCDFGNPTHREAGSVGSYLGRETTGFVEGTHHVTRHP
jgi:hypothetical protein